MKLIFTLLLFLSPRLVAGTVDFVWDANPAADNVTAYVLYERMADGTARKVVEVAGNVTTASGTFGAGQHTVFVTAKTGQLESLPSVALIFPALPSAPTALRIPTVPPALVPPK